MAGLGLTSARRQVLGAVALAGNPLTAPQIAESMGITRQGAQKQLNLLTDEGLLERRTNPAHERSPLYALSPSGAAAYAGADRLCDLWCADLGETLSKDTLHTVKTALDTLLEQLDRPLPHKAHTA